MCNVPAFRVFIAIHSSVVEVIQLIEVCRYSRLSKETAYSMYTICYCQRYLRLYNACLPTLLITVPSVTWYILFLVEVYGTVCLKTVLRVWTHQGRIPTFMLILPHLTFFLTMTSTLIKNASVYQKSNTVPVFITNRAVMRYVEWRSSSTRF